MVKEIGNLGRFGGLEMDLSGVEKSINKELTKQIQLELRSVGRLEDLMLVIRHHLAKCEITLYEGKFDIPTVSYRKDGKFIEERFPTMTQAVDRALTLFGNGG